MKESRMQATPHKCRGATMIEVLVSLFVLAIGLLGVLGMQAEGNLANQRGMFSSQAAFLAQSMADRIRVNDRPNTLGVSAGIYDGTDTGGSPSATYTASTDCESVECGQNALLAYDRAAWEQGLEGQLPGGQGGVDWDNANQLYTISVIWQERAGDQTDSIDLTQAECGALDPPQGFACYQLEVRP